MKRAIDRRLIGRSSDNNKIAFSYSFLTNPYADESRSLYYSLSYTLQIGIVLLGVRLAVIQTPGLAVDRYENYQHVDAPTLHHFTSLLSHFIF